MVLRTDLNFTTFFFSFSAESINTLGGEREGQEREGGKEGNENEIK